MSQIPESDVKAKLKERKEQQSENPACQRISVEWHALSRKMIRDTASGKKDGEDESQCGNRGNVDSHVGLRFPRTRNDDQELEKEGTRMVSRHVGRQSGVWDWGCRGSIPPSCWTRGHVRNTV